MIIDNIEELNQKLGKLRNQNKKIGAISGGFDIFHTGHKKSLKYCIERVDHLVVLVNSDSSIKLYKGKNRPINSLKSRLQELQKFIPEASFFPFNEIVPNEVLTTIRPNIYFISEEWAKNPVERLVIENFNGKIEVHPQVQNISTTELIKDKKQSNGAIFLDRDGTINKDKGYINSIDDVEIPKENIQGIKAMSQLKLNIFIVTNQSGVAKNLISLEQLKLVNAKIIEILTTAGGKIDKTFFDTSDSSNPSFKRKPNPGMIYEALEEFDIALVKSWIIGDKDSDMLLGKFCNMRTIYIKNSVYKYESKLKPDFEVNNLMDAYKIIKENL